MILVKADYETALKYEKTGCVSKVGNKKHQVLFKVDCDSTSIDACISLYKRFPNVVVLEYQGDAKELAEKDVSGTRVIVPHDVGTNVSPEEVDDISRSTPSGVIAMIKVPINYSDMRFVHDMSQKYDNIRFCGGLLFRLDGCNLGCCDCALLEKKRIKHDDSKYIFEGCSCAVDSYPLDEVELEEGKPLKNNSGGSSGAKKPSKKTVKMQELFSQFGTFEL